jgi:hypothetical protein
MDRTIGTPGGNRPDLARFDPPSRNEAEGGHVSATGSRKENRKLRVEREIRAKATAWFAREADTM